MKVGLYLDVTVGVQSDGFDAWNEQAAISRQLIAHRPTRSIPLARIGGWPASPLEIRSFEPYRETLRASMRHAGGIGLDHVLGLKRLYPAPCGFGPENGAYVQMPFEALSR